MILCLGKYLDSFSANKEEESYAKHPNANKKWTRSADNFLLTLYHEGKSIKYIAEKMGRSQTSIVMRLGKLEGKRQ